MNCSLNDKHEEAVNFGFYTNAKAVGMLSIVEPCCQECGVDHVMFLNFILSTRPLIKK